MLLLCALAVAPAFAAPAAAQGELGTITGRLTDAQGGVLPGVTATAVNTETNVKTTALANDAGVYVLTSLVNGRYRLTFTLDGFAPAARDLELRAGDRLRVEVGKLGQRGRVERDCAAARRQLHELPSQAAFEDRDALALHAHWMRTVGLSE